MGSFSKVASLCGQPQNPMQKHFHLAPSWGNQRTSSIQSPVTARVQVRLLVDEERDGYQVRKTCLFRFKSWPELPLQERVELQGSHLWLQSSVVFRRCEMDQTEKFVNIAGIPS